MQKGRYLGKIRRRKMYDISRDATFAIGTFVAEQSSSNNRIRVCGIYSTVTEYRHAAR